MEDSAGSADCRSDIRGDVRGDIRGDIRQGVDSVQHPAPGFAFAFAIDGMDPQLTISQQKRKRETGSDAQEEPDQTFKRAAATNFFANFPPKFDWFRFNPPPIKTQTFRT